MRHRGPDGAGLWRSGPVVLAHRRLAVIDTTEAGAQPMVTPDGRGAIVYNGELYNDAELRRELAPELAARGQAFRTACDTETVLWAMRLWGEGAINRFRGMYALGYYDADAGTLTLARDPLGIKPLYWWRGIATGGTELVFASEIGPILDHPAVTPRPDLAGVSAYITTIRTTVGERTLYENVRTLRPGQVLRVNLRGEEPRIASVRDRAPLSAWANARATEETKAAVRGVVCDSVRRHLRSDVPACCLLSGGLDSSIIAAVAGPIAGELWTYCSGADESGKGEDFEFARQVAAAVGSVHTEAPVGREMFRDRWEEVVACTGVPLSTPNEVAINEVARRLRADGKIVALSGEGADELFAGYEGPMQDAARFVASGAGCEAHRRPDPGRFQLDSTAWVSLDVKRGILNESVWRGLEADAALLAFYREEFAAVAAEREDPDPLQAHLRFHRRVNLAGLLLRLDSATALEGVEGRTPFADVAVAALAESLPMREKFDAGGGAGLTTKKALREAFSPDLPPAVVARAKASFPLPFQQWVADAAPWVRESALVKELFTEAAAEAVAAQPTRLWNLAWPMINLSLWARRWG